MSGRPGISADQKKLLLKTTGSLASTATLLFARALRRFQFPRLVPHLSCPTRWSHAPARQPLRMMMQHPSPGPVEPASLSQSTVTLRLSRLHPPRQAEADRTAGVLRPPCRALMVENRPVRRELDQLLAKHRHPLPVGRPRPSRVQRRGRITPNGRRPGARAGPTRRSIALRVIRHGWQLCTSRTRVFLPTSRSSPPMHGKSSKSSGRKRVKRPPPMTVDSPPWPSRRISLPLRTRSHPRLRQSPLSPHSHPRRPKQRAAPGHWLRRRSPKSV